MKQTSMLFVTVMSIMTTTTCAQPFPLNIRPKIGMELGQRILKWQDNMGKNHFAENLPQLDLFIEVPLLEQFSVKLGHERTVQRTRMVPYAADSVVLNSPTPPNPLSCNYATTTKLTASYAEAIYNYTLINMERYKIQLLAFIGLSRGKIKLTQENVTFATIDDRLLENLTTSKKTFLRKGIGIQSSLRNGLSLKMGLTFEKTSKFMSTLITENDIYTAKAKNSTIFNIGISYML